jgi:hypothetical protein
MKLVEQMNDQELLTTFGTSEDPERRGFDEETWARVVAHELVRSRHRLAHYRALYAAFLEADKPYMIENLDEIGDGQAVPAKVAFTDDVEQVMGLEESEDVVVWTEPDLLDGLSQERGVLDFLTGLLDELEPAVAL